MEPVFVGARYGFLFFFFFFFASPRHCAACGILVPQRGTEAGPSAVKVWSPNHWTAREFPDMAFSATS